MTLSPHRTLPSRTAPQIVIIGAGITGLTVANDLIQQGYSADITIVEKGARPGGRLTSEPLRQGGAVVEFGAGRYHPQQHPSLHQLRAELGLQVQPFHYPVSYGGRELPQSAAKSSEAFQRMVCSLQAARPAEQGTFPVFAEELLGKDQFAYLVAQAGYDTLSNRFLPAEGGMSILLDHPEGQSYFTGNTHPWYSIPEGFQQLAVQLEKRVLGKVRLCYETEARQITAVDNSSPRRFRVALSEAGQERSLECDIVVLAIPPHEANRLAGLNRLEKCADEEAVEHVPLLKGFIQFDRPWWLAQGLQNQCIVNETPLRKVYIPAEHDILWFYCDGQSALEAGRLLQEAASDVKGLLERHIGCEIPEQAVVKAFKWKLWPRGISFFKHREQPGREFCEAIPNLLRCSDMYTKNVGWIEGALTSAHAAAKRLLAA